MKIGKILKADINWVQNPYIFDIPIGSLDVLDRVFTEGGCVFQGSMDEFARYGEQMGYPYYFVIDCMREMAEAGWITIEADGDTFTPTQLMLDRYG